jgi:hypothetical protein
MYSSLFFFISLSFFCTLFSSSSDIPPNFPDVSPSKKTSSSSSSSSSSSIISKFSNVFSCCQVGPPEEDIELLRHISRKLLDPPVVISNDKNNENMGESVVPLI